MPLLRSLKTGSAKFNSQKISVFIRINEVMIMTTETEALIEKIDDILNHENGTSIKDWKCVDKELIEQIENNETALLYIVQDPKKGHKLLETCFGSTFEEFTILIINRTENFADCMTYLTSHWKELNAYVLSRAEKLATSSEHYLILAEKYPLFNEEKKREYMLQMASQLARSTEEYVKTIEVIANHGFPFYADHKKAIELLIERSILSTDASFDTISKIYNIIEKIYGNPPKKYVDFFKKITVKSAIKSDIPFVHKEKLKEYDMEKEFSSAEMLMTCIIILEGIKKDSQILPEGSHAKKIIEDICRNNK
jgi:hypothetical protein